MNRRPSVFMEGVVVAAALGASLGCERMPWSSGQQDQATASTAGSHPAAPPRPPVLPSDVVAAVNKVPISKKDVELRLQELKALTEASGGQWQSLSADQLEAVLDELVHTELMNQDALARGLDRTLNTQQRLEYLRRGFFAQEWLRWHQERQAITAADVEQYYEQNKLGFREPERRRLRQLVVGSEPQAKQALAQLLGGTVDFANLAQQISQGPTASAGGLLSGWVMRANDRAFVFPSAAEAEAAGVIGLDPALEAAAFAVDQVNGLSNYVKGADDRYHIFQLVERQDERQRPLTEVYEDIKTFLAVQHLQQTVDELSSKATIERFPDRLEGLAQ